MAQAARFGGTMTVDEFLEANLPEGKSELVRGEVRMTPPAGGPHATVTSNVISMLMAYAKTHRAGRVFTDGAGYELTNLPRTVRVPDGSFVRAGRLPPEGVGRGLLKMAPDLAVEVLSPSERASDIDEKLDDYAAGGTPLVWIIDPERRTVMIVTTDSPVRWLREGDTLDGGTILPSFTAPVTEIFDGVARESHQG